MKFGYVFLAVFFIFLASCQEQKPTDETSQRKEMNSADSIQVREQIHAKMLDEATAFMDSNSYDESILACFPYYQPEFSIREDRLGIVLVEGERIEHNGNIAERIVNHYTIKLRKGNSDSSSFALKRRRELPKFVVVSKDSLQIQIYQNFKDLYGAIADQNSDLELFHRKKSVSLFTDFEALKTLEIDVFIKHDLHPIVIISEKEQVTSALMDEVLQGIYLLRNGYSEGYLKMSYLELYWKAKNSEDVLWQKRLDAIHCIQPIQIIDGNYLADHKKQFPWYYPEQEIVQEEVK